MDTAELPSLAFLIVIICTVSIYLGTSAFGQEETFSFSKTYPPFIQLIRFVTGTASLIMTGIYLVELFRALPPVS